MDLNKLYKFKNRFFSVLYAMAMIGLAIATILVLLGTLARYFAGISYEWVSEICRYCVIMAAFFLSGPLLYNRDNVALDAITNAIKNPKAKMVVNSVIYYLSSLIVVVVMLVASIILFIDSKGQVTYSFVFPVRIPYSLLPVGMTISIISIILKFILRNYDEESDQEEIREGIELGSTDVLG